MFAVTARNFKLFMTSFTFPIGNVMRVYRFELFCILYELKTLCQINILCCLISKSHNFVMFNNILSYQRFKILCRMHYRRQDQVHGRLARICYHHRRWQDQMQARLVHPVLDLIMTC